MMRFCRECNNMLYPRENRERKRLEYVCQLKDCNYVERNVENSCVFVNELIKDSSSVFARTRPKVVYPPHMALPLHARMRTPGPGWTSSTAT